MHNTFLHVLKYFSEIAINIAVSYSQKTAFDYLFLPYNTPTSKNHAYVKTGNGYASQIHLLLTVFKTHAHQLIGICNSYRHVSCVLGETHIFLGDNTCQCVRCFWHCCVTILNGYASELHIYKIGLLKKSGKFNENNQYD